MAVTPNPVWRVEVAFSAGPFADPDAATWTDISDDVMSAQGSTGRSPEAGRTSTGTCQVEVWDPTGKYDPANTSSPYYPNVKLDRLLRVRFSDVADRVVADAPVAFWRLDETSGILAAEEITGYIGTYVNTPTLGVGGSATLEPSTSVSFASASSERVDVSYQAVLNPSTVTVEAWIYASGSGVRSIVTSLTSNRGYRLRMNASNRIEWSVGNGASTSTVTGSVTVSPSTWTHVVATSTASAQTLYVDGVVDGTGSLTYSPAVSGTLQIAADNSTNYFNGRIDNVAVYNTALPADAVAQHCDMAAGRACRFTGQVKDWRQNYGAGAGATTVTIDATDLAESLERVSAPLDHEAIVRRLAPDRWYRYNEIATGRVTDEGSSPQPASASAQAVISADPVVGYDLTINGGVTYPLKTPGLDFGTADFTVSMWARSDTTGYTEQVTLLARPDWPLGSGTYVHLSHWRQDVRAGSDARNFVARCGRLPSSTAWTHYVMVRQTYGGNEHVTVWVNGDEAGTYSWAGAATNITGTTPVTAQPVLVGGTIHIAQLAVWDGQVLTDDEIAMLWQSGPPRWQHQRPEERIDTALTLAGVAASTQLGRGSSLLAPTVGGTALSICQDAAVADEGMFFIDGRGRPTFFGRQSRRRLGSAPVYTFGDSTSSTSEIGYDTVVLNNDDSRLWTAAIVNGQRAVDTTAATTYGERSPGSDESRSVLTARDSKCRAEGIVAAHKDPATRIDEISWQLPQQRGSALVMQLALNDWIRVVRRPRAGQTITRDLHVESLRWHVAVGGGGGNAGVATMRAQLVASDPGQNTAVTLGTSTYAGTDDLSW